MNGMVFEKTRDNKIVNYKNIIRILLICLSFILFLCYAFALDEKPRKETSIQISEPTSPTIETEKTGSEIILINNGAKYANTTEAVLTILPPRKASQMCLSKDGRNIMKWEPFAQNKKWELISGDGTKEVFVWLSDNDGNVLGPYSDKIILDTVPPGEVINLTIETTNVNWGLPPGTPRVKDSWRDRIKWKNPYDHDFVGVLIKEGAKVKNPIDGSFIKKVEGFPGKDEVVENYYSYLPGRIYVKSPKKTYTLFTFDSAGNFSRGFKVRNKQWIL